MPKQARQAWYNQIDAYFNKAGLTKCPCEHSLYTKVENGKLFIVCLYVNDLFYNGNDHVLLKNFKKLMMSEFKMMDLSLMRYFLGIEVKHYYGVIFISQKKYVKKKYGDLV